MIVSEAAHAHTQTQHTSMILPTPLIHALPSRPPWKRTRTALSKYLFRSSTVSFLLAWGGDNGCVRVELNRAFGWVVGIIENRPAKEGQLCRRFWWVALRGRRPWERGGALWMCGRVPYGGGVCGPIHINFVATTSLPYTKTHTAARTMMLSQSTKTRRHSALGTNKLSAALVSLPAAQAPPVADDDECCRCRCCCAP